MRACRHCASLFVAEDWQTTKSDFECTPCRKSNKKQYRANRKAAGNPVVSGKMTPEYHKNYGIAYTQQQHVKDRNAKNARGLRENPDHPEQMARLGWQYFECPACGSEGARAFPKPEESTIKQSLTVEQEPVAYVHNETGLLRRADRPKGGDFEPSHWTPLYTSPPQRQPLTDDEIVNLRNEHRHWYALSRAIEAAHGIGDKT